MHANFFYEVENLTKRMKDKILSIQSKLAYGYVGNNVAELAIQLHGLDIISLPTVYFAAHTGHQPVYGREIDVQLFDDLIKGVENLDVIESTIHMVSGYIASEAIIDSTAGFLKKIKEEYPDKLYICDPVMGDVGGLYVSESVANRVISHLIPLCDIMTPNHFEFEYITKSKLTTIESIVETVSTHPVLKNKTVVITSCTLEDTPKGEIETVIIKGENFERITAHKVNIQAIGTGDLFTAVLTAQLALGKSIVEAVTEAMQVLSIGLNYAVGAGKVEMNAKSLMLSVLRNK